MSDKLILTILCEQCTVIVVMSNWYLLEQKEQVLFVCV